MNFYKHHIGDYAQATLHLSFVEDAAYSRLMRKYYAEEKPLPADIKSVQRIVGARARDEREAVETVLNEFFVLESDGWHNKRCDAELDVWRKQAETNRRTAEEREAKKRNNKSSTTTSTNRADYDNDSLDESSTPTWRSREPNQNPESRIQNPELKPSPLPNDDDGTPNGASVSVSAWSCSELVFRHLEFLHHVPEEFIEIQLAEFRTFWRDSPKKQPAGQWDARFLQRCAEQFARSQRGAA